MTKVNESSGVFFLLEVCVATLQRLFWLSRLCALPDARPALSISAGHLEEQSGAESCGHDVPCLWTQRQVRLNQVGGAFEKKKKVLYTDQLTILCSVFSMENLQLCVGPLLHSLLTNIEGKLEGTSSEADRLDPSGWTHQLTCELRTPLWFWSFFKLSAERPSPSGSCFCTPHMIPLWFRVWWLWGFSTWNGHRLLLTSP